ncbi:MAG: hypothetical protein H6742_13855 [Alphaproteobacteria bacterium]|nr:hypothetical protein [Alphaproteobacteria bacterium]
MLLLSLILACTDPVDAALDAAEAALVPPAVDRRLAAPTDAAPRLLVGARWQVDARAWAAQDGWRDAGLADEALALAREAAAPLDPQTDHSGRLLRPLHSVLSDLVALQGQAASAGFETPTADRLRLRIDGAQPAEALWSAVHTAGQAGFGGYELELSGPDGDTVAQVSLPGIGGFALGPEIQVRGDAVAVVSGFDPPADAGPAVLALDDTAALDAALAALSWPPPSTPPPDPSLLQLLGATPVVVRLLVDDATPLARLGPVLARAQATAAAADGSLQLAPLPEGVALGTAAQDLTGTRVACDAAALLAARAHIPPQQLAARWREVPDDLITAVGSATAVLARLPMSRLDAWTALPDGGHAGLVRCVVPGAERPEGSVQLLWIARPDAAPWSAVVGEQDCCGHRWWTAPRLSTQGGTLFLDGELDTAGSAPEPPRRGPARLAVALDDPAPVLLPTTTR